MKNLFQLLHESHQVVAFALIALICNIAKTVCVPTIGFLVFFMCFFVLFFFVYVFCVFFRSIFRDFRSNKNVVQQKGQRIAYILTRPCMIFFRFF